MVRIDPISAMDWVTPISKFLHDARYLWQVREITIPDDFMGAGLPAHVSSHWTMADIAVMLTEKGVENWGQSIWGDQAYFTVRKRDYDRAIQLIQETVMNPRAKRPRHTPLSFLRGFFQDRFAWLIWLAAIAVIAILLLPRLVG